MLNIKVSIHIALTSLAVLLYAPMASAMDCAQEAAMGIVLPQCKPAASAPCYVVGGHSEICSSEPANRLAVDEWRPEYPCYSKYGICERDGDGQCAWRDTDDLSQCIANAQRGLLDSVIRCTLCPPPDEGVICCPPKDCE
jgi:hypothetical protein